MNIDMKSFAREGAKARRWQLDEEVLGGAAEGKGRKQASPWSPQGSGKRKGISAAGRAAIAAAQKKRWAKLRKDGEAKAKVTGKSSAGKRLNS
jgi:hypothetical protein